MARQTKAVFSVPFHYSVPERIGLGLSRSGTKILFTTLANIFALAIIWYFVDVVPVREFCLFAITVNITDWFMLHTFYLTVSSSRVPQRGSCGLTLFRSYQSMHNVWS